MRTCVRLWKHLAEFFSEWEMFQTKAADKIKTHTHTLHFQYFFCENRADYEMMWQNVEPDRPQMTIRCMRSACWIIRTTNILPKYAIFIAFPRQQWLLEIASILGTNYTVCLVSLQMEAQNSQKKLMANTPRN